MKIVYITGRILCSDQEPDQRSELTASRLSKLQAACLDKSFAAFRATIAGFAAAAKLDGPAKVRIDDPEVRPTRHTRCRICLKVALLA